MKKRGYRAQKVNQIPWEEMAQRVKEKVMALAIEVVKTNSRAF